MATEPTELQATSEPTWVPAEACTLPSAERPIRLAEFEQLFGLLRGLQRREPGWLQLRLPDAPALEELVREVTARERECCSFFDFAVRRTGGEVVVDVRVPDSRVVVLDGLTALAAARVTIAKEGR